LQTKQLTNTTPNLHAYTEAKMRSELQNNASRANGAKSHGPVTPEGRLASAGNRTDHGMLAAAIVLDGEAPDRLAALSEAFHQKLQPRDEIEDAYVDTMVLCRWRQIRLWELESANVNFEIRKQALAHESETKRTRGALAFRALSDQSHSLELMNRYETRFFRQFNRAHQCLLNLRDRETRGADQDRLADLSREADLSRDKDLPPDAPVVNAFPELPPEAPNDPISPSEPTECILPLEPEPDESYSKQEPCPETETRDPHGASQISAAEPKRAANHRKHRRRIELESRTPQARARPAAYHDCWRKKGML
jgi:hypothetical protein